MSQVVMNAYDADVFIPEFKGLKQYGDHMGDDLRYSPDAINVETPGGVLQPTCLIDGVEIKLCVGLDENDQLVYLDPAEIGTLMYLRDKYRTSGMTPYSVNAGEGGYSSSGGMSRSPFSVDRNVYFVSAGGKIFALYVAGDLKESGTYTLRKLEFASGDNDPPAGYEFRSDRWSWCTYEYTANETTRNVLLFSNPDDGMFMIDPATLYIEEISSGYYRRTDLMCIKRVDTPVKFGWIECYADRIWGVGAGRYADDTIYYSRPYNATDWTQNSSDPANGGGEIREPSWERDHFVSLKAFGDCLVAQTRKRAWKITGTDPTNFVIQEQYGYGCDFPDTIVNMGKYLMMLGSDSLVTYDGYSVTPFMKEATYELFRTIGIDDNCKPFAVRVGDKYVLTLSNEIGDNLKKAYGQQFTAVPDPETGINQTLGITGTSQDLTQKRKYYNVIYDMVDGTINVSEVPEVVSLCELMPYMLTYEPATVNSPAKNKLCPIRFDSWERQQVTPKAVKWVSPWITFGRTDIKKGGFDVYFTPEVKKKKVFNSQWWPESNVRGHDIPSKVIYTETAGNVNLKFTIQTEKKSKTKEYTVTALTDTEIAEGKEYKMKKLHFGGSGRRFRLIIECEAGNTIPWRLIGGIHIIAEIDKD